ncbi:AP2/B3-like transcriptional factor family protein [Wolffia australiana]
MEDDGSYPVQDLSHEDAIMAGIETDLLFSDEAFPSLPEFPCLSSPSNAACPSSSSSSNSSSERDHHDNHHHHHDQMEHADGQASSSAMGDGRRDQPAAIDSECSMYVDLLGSSDESWDPFSLFPEDLDAEELLLHEGEAYPKQAEQGEQVEDLASVFLEWLRNNKESISPEDLRSIKLKRSTIESAAHSLGGGRDGMKKLLQLILTWVQSTHLHKRRRPFFGEEDSEILGLFQQAQSNPCVPLPAFSQHLPQYSAFPSSYGHYQGGQLFQQVQGEPFVRLGSSATKEARKKRMARQKRFSSLHHHHHHHHHHQRNVHQEISPRDLRRDGVCSQMDGHGSWGFGSTTAVASSQQSPRVQDQDKRQVAILKNVFSIWHLPSANNQEWKAEKNLRFLLQKVLKQSDVGSLGRIVLPKKEAETHLPELQTRDGMTLVMEDIVTSQIWNMRYRFWPNNKSRMYLLENTGEFVRSNGLQEGDFIVIYSDIKCGKYMIRGVKVRQTADCIQSGNNSFKLNPMDAEVKRDGGWSRNATEHAGINGQE